MTCKQCKAEGKKSRVYSHGGMTTLMFSDRYYDEDGKLHNHDPNHTDASYSCSNGHEWGKRIWTTKCPSCDYAEKRQSQHDREAAEDAADLEKYGQCALVTNLSGRPFRCNWPKSKHLGERRHLVGPRHKFVCEKVDA